MHNSPSNSLQDLKNSTQSFVDDCKSQCRHLLEQLSSYKSAAISDLQELVYPQNQEPIRYFLDEESQNLPEVSSDTINNNSEVNQEVAAPADDPEVELSQSFQTSLPPKQLLIKQLIEEAGEEGIIFINTPEKRQLYLEYIQAVEKQLGIDRWPSKLMPVPEPTPEEKFGEASFKLYELTSQKVEQYLALTKHFGKDTLKTTLKFQENLEKKVYNFLNRFRPV